MKSERLGCAKGANTETQGSASWSIEFAGESEKGISLTLQLEHTPTRSCLYCGGDTVADMGIYHFQTVDDKPATLCDVPFTQCPACTDEFDEPVNFLDDDVAAIIDMLPTRTSDSLIGGITSDD